MTEKEFRVLLKLEGKRLQVKAIKAKVIWHVADIVGETEKSKGPLGEFILFWGSPFSSVRKAVNDTRKRYYLRKEHD